MTDTGQSLALQRASSRSPDPEATDYAALRRQLVRVVAKICPSWLSSDRDDLVQAAVMRVMQRVAPTVGTERSTAPPASYIFKVAYSALVDEIRRVRRRRETDLDGEIVETVASPESPERTAFSREIGRGIRHCLATLKRERRLAVTLYLQGYSAPRAAVILGWPSKRTENLVFRGLGNLRACLQSKGLRP